MNLTDYIKANADKEGFADACGTTLGHLRNVGYGYRACGERLASAIESKSAGKVTRKELRPSDWKQIWPELDAVSV